MNYLRWIASSTALVLPLFFGSVAVKAKDADLVATAASTGTFSTLIEAVKAAGLEDTLKSDGPFTIFAPTDEAFAALPEGKLERLLLPENRERLLAILTSHVVAARLSSAEIAGNVKSIKTMSGQRVSVDRVEGFSKIDQAAIKQPDVEASNGVIHVIDKVIIPE